MFHIFVKCVFCVFVYRFDAIYYSLFLFLMQFLFGKT